MAVDNKSGEVWFGTSKGVQSFRGDATGGAEKFTKVYTFPNPVREDFTGNVTITGLIRDSQIRITDISGNLVYETVSDGGQATWDLNTYKGNVLQQEFILFFVQQRRFSIVCNEDAGNKIQGLRANASLARISVILCGPQCKLLIRSLRTILYYSVIKL